MVRIDNDKLHAINPARPLISANGLSVPISGLSDAR